MKNKYDSIIIGFGKGGKTLAAHLAKRGERVAVLEQSDRMYGGTCINVGCIPSKSLVKSASISAAHPLEPFEMKARRYREAIEEKRRVVGLLRGKNYRKLQEDPNITVIHAKASFVGPKTVEAVMESGSLTVTAEKIFINTGSVSVIPDIKGLVGNEHVYFSDTLMELDTLPKQLVIVGGGYIGLEFASMYASFGSNVMVMQPPEEFLPREDADVAVEIRKLLEKQGIEFRLGVEIKELAADGTVFYQWKGSDIQLRADAILIATGRRPNTEALNLAAAGVEISERGAILVDEWLRTSQPGIWALGDVNGGLQFTYISLDDYRVVASQLAGGDYSRKKRRNVPYSVFMATPFSRVGMSEAEARAAGLNIKTAVMPVSSIPKAQTLRETEGMLKAVVDADNGRILGAALLCAESHEMINTIKLAMDFDAPYTVLRDQVVTHPTMSEAWNDLFAIE